MNNLVVDVGNTRTKFAVFNNGDEILQKGYSESELYQAIPRYAPMRTLLVASGDLSDELRTFLAAYSDPLIEARPDMPLPLEIKYETPQTLGFDRVASCCGAQSLSPESPFLLVIDIGTAITYNYMENGQFIGGNISPGISMRFRALHDYTAHLPLLDYTDTFCRKPIGKNTHDAMVCGVLQGVEYEIEKYMETYSKEKMGKTEVWMTGGFAKYIDISKNQAINYNLDLNFIGLNTILKKQ